MNYPEEFIRKCKEAYPTWGDLHHHLEAGHMIAGRLLDDASQGSIPLDTILKTTDLKQLQDQAREHKMKRELYGEWCDTWNKMSHP